eukprot:1454459-Amphidinium_carterae.1
MPQLHTHAWLLSIGTHCLSVADCDVKRGRQGGGFLATVSSRGQIRVKWAGLARSTPAPPARLVVAGAASMTSIVIQHVEMTKPKASSHCLW